MDFAFKGLSWAENMCQKLEKICADSDIVQNSCKYIDAVGEHFRTVLDEVAADWRKPSDDCVEKPVADFSLEHGLLSEVSENSEAALHGNPLDKDQLACVVPESVFSSSTEELNSATTSNMPSNLSQEIGYSESSNKLISISGKEMTSSCADPTQESSMHGRYSVASHSDVTDPLQSADEGLPSESDQNEVTGKELMLSGCLSQKIDDSCTSVGTDSLVRSIVNDCNQHLELNKSETPGQVPEIVVTERSDGFDSGRTFNIPNMIDQNADFVEEFEDVEIDDYVDDIVAVEVAFISKSKKRSYKKKLKDAIISKMLSRKSCKIRNSYVNADLELPSGQIVSDPSVPGYSLCHETSSDHKSCDSDWELL